MSDAVAPRRSLGPWRAGLALGLFRPARYLLGGMLWALNHAQPAITGLLLKAIFDRVAGASPAYGSALALLAVLVGVELGRGGVFWSANAVWPGWVRPVLAWLRGNALESLFCLPGPLAGRMPASPGEAIGRLRDDAEDLVWFSDIWVDVTGAVLFAVVALAVMLSIDALVTVVAVLPLAGATVVARVLGGVVRRSHQRQRERGASVTDLVADLFAGILTLKTAGAEARALARFQGRNATRRSAAIRAQLAQDVMASLGGGAAQISIGLVLLLAAGAMREGRFTVGDLALFTTYATSLTILPRWVGRLLSLHRVAQVALKRLARFHPERSTDRVLDSGLSEVAPPPLAEPLRTLEVRGLTARHAGSGSGVVGVDLLVARGELTVLTGVVGSGKSTLLRALLGLIPLESGAVRWNGEPVAEPSVFLVPPRAAYAGQVARLFSEPLEENLRLGWPADEAALWRALELAQFAEDVAGMPDAMATVVGPRGSRLSGGQLQRAATARALVRVPELLILDDVSSALDGATEDRLWQALAASGTTCLVASHRRAALERADHVVVLDRGRVVAAGPPALLAETSSLFRSLLHETRSA